MSIIALSLSCILLVLPIIAVLDSRFMRVFFLAMVGANPYIIAGSILLSCLLHIKSIVSRGINLKQLLFFLLWLGYGGFIGLSNFSMTFVSEFIQLGIAILLSIYVYQNINNKEELVFYLKSIAYSALVVCFFEISFFVLDLEVASSNFIGSNSNNYGSFYLIISAIVVPIYLALAVDKLYAFIIPFGIMAISINDSRGMMLLSLFLILKTLLSYNNKVVKLLVSIGIVGFIVFMAMAFDPTMISNGKSIFSVVNFHSNYSNMERLVMLVYCYKLFMGNMFGYGLGSSFELMMNNPYTHQTVYPNPHNTLAFMAIEMGVVGIVVYFSYFALIYQTYFKLDCKHLKSLCFNLLVSLFGFSVIGVLFYNGVITLVCFMLFGLIFSLLKLRNV